MIIFKNCYRPTLKCSKIFGLPISSYCCVRLSVGLSVSHTQTLIKRTFDLKTFDLITYRTREPMH